MASALVGNWSWTVWLLIPLALALAVVTATALGRGSSEESPPSARGGRGVGRHLAESARKAGSG